jgi:hypothetical protein
LLEGKVSKVYTPGKREKSNLNDNISSIENKLNKILIKNSKKL